MHTNLAGCDAHQAVDDAAEGAGVLGREYVQHVHAVGLQGRPAPVDGCSERRHLQQGPSHAGPLRPQPTEHQPHGALAAGPELDRADRFMEVHSLASLAK